MNSLVDLQQKTDRKDVGRMKVCCSFHVHVHHVPCLGIAENIFAERFDTGQRSSSCSHVKVVRLFVYLL